MDIGHFIQLFKRNLLLFIVVPLLMAIVVFYFTRNQPKAYESETIIYTGITTGYSIESTSQRPTDFFSVSAQFDNLLNLLKSRQTIVETSIRLLAQDLCLEKPIPQYISVHNYNQLQSFTPKYVKDMVVKNNKTGIQREREEEVRKLQKEIHSLEREISKKKNKVITESPQGETAKSGHATQGISKEYGSTLDKSPEYIYHVMTPGENLSQVASQYGLSVGELLDMNNLSNPNSVSSGQSIIVKKLSGTSSPLYHTVKQGETLYSIAKKYGVNITKLRELNNLTNRSLTPGQHILVDHGTTATSGNYYTGSKKEVLSDGNSVNGSVPLQSNSNLGDKGVYDELPNVPPATSNVDNYKVLAKDYFVSDPIVPPGVKQSDYEKTVKNLTNFYSSSDTNFIYGLLHYGANNHYSIRSISEIQIYRINNSDLVRLVFHSDDPGICMQTLKILSQVFMKDYKLLRENETDLVVRYFEEQVRLADARLQKAEDRLLQFNKKNNIINYYEQSKAIAAQKEDLEVAYQNEQIRLSGSGASLNEIETHLTARDSLYLKSDEVNQLKKELSEVTTKIISNAPTADYDERTANAIAKLQTRQTALRNKIKLYVDQLYLYSHSTQGLPIANMLNEWLKNTIDYVEAKAALVVLARRKMDFVRTYQKYAPLGAMLKRIEREIKVTEQSYLELLHSLNQAKMKQQNLEMATNIKIVDPPFFPISAIPSKTKVLVVAAFLFGFILIAFIILALEYFDSSMKNPSRVIKETEMELAGAYPILNTGSSTPELNTFARRLIDMIIQNLKMGLSKVEKEPKIVLLLSTQKETGKSLLGHKIVNRLREIGDTVLYLNYRFDDEATDEDYNFSYTYTVKDNFIDIKDFSELIGEKALRNSNGKYSYIFVEIPSIIYHSYPINLLQQVDFAFYVLQANSQMTKADKRAIKTFREICPVKPQVILNKVELYALEELLSTIPKKRHNTYIIKIKQVIKYPLKYKFSFKKEA
ncbi:MAG: hypothetical protein DRJ09_01425 [Bacteroidetes bacterium]|nr:MAG: hypothetical protein DRJ09_01425 [Bacteroidota bacterium]